MESLLIPQNAIRLADQLVKACLERKTTIATCESCTGGLIAALITSIAGSSKIFDRGFVTYSNDAKRQVVAVPERLLIEYGAVSVQVAKAMASGTLKNSNAHLAISVTGIAGPTGGSPAKPLGLVYFGIGWKDHPTYHDEQRFDPLATRNTIRTMAAVYGLKILIEQVQRD